MRHSLQTAWRRWTRLAERIAHVQATLLFGLLYFVVVMPFAIGLKLLSDPLQLRARRRDSFWNDLSRQTLRLEDARKQF